MVTHGTRVPTEFLRLPHVGINSAIVKGLITARVWSLVSLQQLVFGFLCFLNQT